MNLKARRMLFKGAAYEQRYNNITKHKKGFNRILYLIRSYIASLLFDKHYILKSDYTIIGADILMNVLIAIKLANEGNRCIIITEPIPKTPLGDILTRRTNFYSAAIKEWISTNIPHVNAATSLDKQLNELVKIASKINDGAGNPLISFMEPTTIDMFDAEKDKSIGVIINSDQPEPGPTAKCFNYLDIINIASEGTFFLASNSVVLTSRTSFTFPLNFACETFFLGDAKRPIELFQEFNDSDRIDELNETLVPNLYNKEPPRNPHYRRYNLV